jgi:hypothetical protein
MGWDWVHLVRQPLTGLLYQPRTIDVECGAVGGMRIGRGIRSTRRKPATVPRCPPQISHHLTWARTGAAVVGSRRLTAWAMARPTWSVSETVFVSIIMGSCRVLTLWYAPRGWDTHRTNPWWWRQEQFPKRWVPTPYLHIWSSKTLLWTDVCQYCVGRLVDCSVIGLAFWYEVGGVDNGYWSHYIHSGWPF